MVLPVFHISGINNMPAPVFFSKVHFTTGGAIFGGLSTNSSSKAGSGPQIHPSHFLILFHSGSNHLIASNGKIREFAKVIGQPHKL